MTEALLYIYTSFNNTIITLTDLNGDVLCWKTAGSCGLRGSRKSTPFAGQLAAETVAKTAKEMGVKAIRVFVSG
ncbi:30S ribosomal protein S11, partial [Acinetobacter baumannii]